MQYGTQIEDAQSNDLVTWQFYGPGGRTKRAVHLNGTSENLGYDGYRFVTDVDHKDSVDATFAGFDYGYDAMGNPLYEERTHQSGAGDCYAYDKAYRLTAALIGSSDPSAECADSDWDDYAHVKLIEYQLDDVSNRTSVDTTPYQGQTSYASYTTNSVNEYTVVDSVNRTHDANGNLTVAGSTSMAYDFRNNLTEVKQGEVTIADYEYDIFNRRTVKYCTEAHFYYDHFDIVEIYGAGDVRLQRIVHAQGIDRPAMLNVRDDNDLDEDEDTSEYLDYYYGFDMLGSVVCLTDADGEVAESVQYDVYGEPSFKGSDGNPIGSSLVLNHFLHAGRYYDEETGLYWNRFRTYDPYTGRFLQRDPLGYVDGENLFEYAASCPTMETDPEGLLWAATIVFKFKDISPSNPQAWENYITGYHGVMFGTPDFARLMYQTLQVMVYWQNFFRQIWLARAGFARVGFPKADGTIDRGLRKPPRTWPPSPHRLMAPLMVGGGLGCESEGPRG